MADSKPTAEERIKGAEVPLYDIAVVFVALEAMGRTVQDVLQDNSELGDAIRRLAGNAHKQLLHVVSDLVG